MLKDGASCISCNTSELRTHAGSSVYPKKVVFCFTEGDIQAFHDFCKEDMPWIEIKQKDLSQKGNEFSKIFLKITMQGNWPLVYKAQKRDYCV